MKILDKILKNSEEEYVKSRVILFTLLITIITLTCYLYYSYTQAQATLESRSYMDTPTFNLAKDLYKAGGGFSDINNRLEQLFFGSSDITTNVKGSDYKGRYNPFSN